MIDNYQQGLGNIKKLGIGNIIIFSINYIQVITVKWKQVQHINYSFLQFPAVFTFIDFFFLHFE